ncbi:MAG: hypothetical protein V1711_01380 [bacterium]
MEIALYKNSRIPYVPFKKGKIEEMFDPKRHGRRELTIFDRKVYRVRESSVWSILMGLRAIKLSIMAHVSICHEQKWHLPNKRMWVQITTLPTSEQSIPIALWNDDLWIHNYNIEKTKELSVVFWKKLFLRELDAARERAYNEKVEVEKKADEMRVRYLFIAGILSKKPE